MVMVGSPESRSYKDTVTCPRELVSRCGLCCSSLGFCGSQWSYYQAHNTPASFQLDPGGPQASLPMTQGPTRCRTKVVEKATAVGPQGHCWFSLVMFALDPAQPWEDSGSNRYTGQSESLSGLRIPSSWTSGDEADLRCESSSE